MNGDPLDGITPRQLIRKLESLPEEQKDMPIMSYCDEAGEFFPFNMTPKEIEAVVTEHKYSGQDKTYFHITTSDEVNLHHVCDAEGFVREIKRKKALLV